MIPRDIAKRLASLEAAIVKPPPAFDLHDVLFEKQLPFGLELARWQTAVCTRRAGKTYGCAAKLLDVALKKPGCVALYITTSRVNAERILWDTLKGINESYSLGGVPLEAKLCLAMPNGSKIYLAGAHHQGEIEKFRGMPIGIVLLDESQALPAYLKKLVDEVLAPALMDYAGALVLIGTPGPVPMGYFHECAVNPTWAHHSWSVMDNPHILRKSGRTPRALLDEELARRGVTETDPVIRREWFGEWVLDTNSLVFRWDPEKNGRDEAKVPCTEFVIGVDLGFDDADAIAVLGWSEASPDLQLVYELVMPKQTITPLLKQIQAAYDRFQPLAVVIDAGGLGKKIAEEMSARSIESGSGLTFEAAEKDRKLEHIELLNDALRTGRFFAPKSSRFAQDSMRVEWDKSNPQKPQISDKFHSDVCDAVLYAYRRCLQWLHVPAKKAPPAVNTPEWHEAQQAVALSEIETMHEKMFEANREAVRQENEADFQWR